MRGNNPGGKTSEQNASAHRRSKTSEQKLLGMTQHERLKVRNPADIKRKVRNSREEEESKTQDSEFFCNPQEFSLDVHFLA